MKSGIKSLILISMLLLVGCSEESGGTNQDEAEESSGTFYESNDVIETIVAYSAGGGSDTTTRYLTPFISKHTPGSPSLQVVNIPGGASLNGANDFAMREADGYSLLASTTSHVIPYLLGKSEIRYELEDWEPIMGLLGNDVVYISTATGYKDPKDLLEFENESIAYSFDDPTSANMRFLLGLEVLRVADKFKLVYGYDGGGAKRIAMEQGEIDVANEGHVSYLNEVIPLVDEGIATPLFQMGILNEEGNFERDPAIDAPTVQELYVELYGEEPSGQIWDAYILFASVGQMQRAIYIHSDAPEEAIQALKEGMESTAEDSELLDGAIDALGTEDILVGERLEAEIEQQRSNITPETIEFTKNLLIEKYNAQGIE